MALKAAWGAKDDASLKQFPAAMRWVLTAVLLVIAPLFAIAVFPFLRRWLMKAMGAAGQGFETVLSERGFGSFLVFSCSEIWNSVPMWAHYAGNHTGFVLGLRATEAFYSTSRQGVIRPVQPRAVRYVKMRPAIRLDRGGTDAMFGSKFSDWRYEREWRYTALSDNAASRGTYHLGHEILLFDLTGRAVSEVIYGLSASAETIKEVVTALTERGYSPKFFKVSQGKGYSFERTTSLDVLEPLPPIPVPSLTDMFIEPAFKLHQQFEAEAKAHPFMKRMFK